MLVKITCPACHHDFKLDQSLCGNSNPCPQCGKSLKVRNPNKLPETLLPKQLSTQTPEETAETLRTLHGSPSSDELAETLVPHENASPVPSQPRMEMIGGYDILGELGRGGMGVVYKARQKGLQRLVALKMILRIHDAGPEERQRFQREAEAMAQIKHENIIQVYEVGEHDGKPFISLEYVEGGSLDKKLRGTPLPPREAARLVEQLANAMEVAHAAGIVHRDLKPANILLANTSSPSSSVAHDNPNKSVLTGFVTKITDFGLAKRQDGAGLSVDGDIMGTPSYMAPEQAAGKGYAVDAKADVYSLGAILYECLTGRPPFRAATALETVMQVLQNEAVPVQTLQPSTPRDLETICHKCLHKEPGRRYGSAHELSEDLGRYLRGEPVSARPVGTLERGWRWCKRNKAVASLLSLVMLLMTLGTTVAWVLAVRADYEADEALRQKGKADRARIRAEESERQAVADQRKTEFVNYSFCLSKAQDEITRGHISKAQVILSVCDSRYRGWEYDYLLRKSNKEIWTIGNDRKVNSVCFRPHGRRLASASGEVVKVWDTETGQCILTLNGHNRVVSSVCFSLDDGRYLASGSWDQTVKVWDTATGQCSLTLKGHTGDVTSVCFSSDGKRLASGARDGTVRVWDASTGEVTLILPEHKDSVSSVCFSPDGKRLASASGSKVRVWDSVTGKEVLSLAGHRSTVLTVCFSLNGKRLASAGGDQTVRVWDASTGEVTLILPEHKGSVSSVCFSPDGKRLASASRDKTVKVWDATTGEMGLTFLGHTDSVSSVCFSPDGKHLASAGEDQTVRVWNAEMGPETSTIKGHSDSVSSVCFSPDGKRLASGSRDQTVKVWDATKGQDTLTLKGHSSEVFSVSFSPDSKRLASASWNMVKVWDTETCQLTLSLDGHKSLVKNICFSQDGNRLASASLDHTVKVWDTATGQCVLTLKGHTDSVSSVCFSSDGKRLTSASQDKTVKVWDTVSGKVIFTIKGHSGAVTSVCFSPKDKRIASSSEDQTIKVWDATTGQEALTLKGHTGGLTGVCFSPDGTRIVSSSEDQTIKVWDAR